MALVTAIAQRWSDAGRYAAPLSVWIAATLIALLVLPAAPRPDLLATGLTLDFTLLAPLLAYLLLVRPGRAPWPVLIPALAVGAVLATLTLPAEHRGTLKLMELLLVPLELVLVACLVLAARRALGDATAPDRDFVDRLRAAARRVLGARVPADALTTEVAILYHAFRRPGRAADGEGVFTAHREIAYGAIVAGLSMVILVETLALHFLIGMWSTTAAWIVSALSVYTLVWLVGDGRAFVARPIRVGEDTLRFRMGLRWEADVPLERIVEARRLEEGSDRPRHALAASPWGAPNVALRFDEPIGFTGVYGLSRRTDELWLRVDRADAFLDAVRPA